MKKDEPTTDQMKSIRLPKGPQKPIGQDIQREAIAPLKVEVNMKQINKSVVQLRAEKEGNAYMLQKSAMGMDQSLKTRQQQQQQPTPKENKTPQLDTSHQSRGVLSSEGLMKETKRKTNYELFFEILSYRILSDYSKELAVIRFNNDTLTAILSSIDRLDPNIGGCFAQELLTKVK